MSGITATGTVLDRILETKRAEVAGLRARVKIADLMARCADLPPTRGFRAALTTPQQPDSPFALIAEIKRASPSRGIIRADFDPVALARAYEDGGANCLSVLTDETYFGGHLDYLAAVRAQVPLPLLRKDFVVDPIQIYESRVAGADAILLIVAATPSPARLAELRIAAQGVGLDVLVEVHDRAELDIAAESGASLIGVNNRDLRTFEVRLDRAETLIPHFPPGAVAVAESGILTHADAVRLAHAGARAMLVGESLMRAADVAAATRQLMTGMGNTP